VIVTSESPGANNNIWAISLDSVNSATITGIGSMNQPEDSIFVTNRRWIPMDRECLMAEYRRDAARRNADARGAGLPTEIGACDLGRSLHRCNGLRRAWRLARRCAKATCHPSWISGAFWGWRPLHAPSLAALDNLRQFHDGCRLTKPFLRGLYRGFGSTTE